MQSTIEQLRYVRLGASDLAVSIGFARDMLGLQLVAQTEHMAYLRSDARDHTLVYVADSAMQVVGFEVRNEADLGVLATKLATAGHPIEHGDAQACADRRVRALLVVTDASGNRIEFVVRPLHSGWRYFPSRDTGITGLAAVALRSTGIAEDEHLWVALLGVRVSDRVGYAAYLRLDQEHHRIALHPSTRHGILAVEFAVESIDQVMQGSYFFAEHQVRIAHGPGRRPSSGQIFLTVEGPDGILYSLVTEAPPLAETHHPRQFARTPGSFCCWGSRSEVPEFAAGEMP